MTKNTPQVGMLVPKITPENRDELIKLAEAGELQLHSLRVIAYKPELAQLFGSINTAIYYQQLCHWQQFGTREDGFIYKTARDIEAETFISEKQQRKCRKILEELGWLEVRKEMANGSATYHFKIRIHPLTSLMPTGKRPVATGQKASSITKNTHENKTVSSEMQEKTEKIYKGYLIRFKISPDRWQYADNPNKPTLISEANKKYRLTDTRRAKVAARIKDCGFEQVKKAIIGYSKSPWHHGDDPKSNGWYADLEWICHSKDRIIKGIEIGENHE